MCFFFDIYICKIINIKFKVYNTTLHCVRREFQSIMAMSSSSSTRSLSDESYVEEDKHDKIPQSLLQDELQLALNKV